MSGFKPIKVAWSYKGESGTLVYSEYATEYGLTEGNDSCDCNKLDPRNLGNTLTPEKYPELYHLEGEMYPDGSGPVDETHPRCGDKIKYVIRRDSQGKEQDGTSISQS